MISWMVLRHWIWQKWCVIPPKIIPLILKMIFKKKYFSIFIIVVKYKKNCCDKLNYHGQSIGKCRLTNKKMHQTFPWKKKGSWFSTKEGSENTKNFYENSIRCIQTSIVMSHGVTDNEGNPIFDETKKNMDEFKRDTVLSKGTGIESRNIEQVEEWCVP